MAAKGALAASGVIVDEVGRRRGQTAAAEIRETSEFWWQIYCGEDVGVMQRRWCRAEVTLVVVFTSGDEEEENLS